MTSHEHHEQFPGEDIDAVPMSTATKITCILGGIFVILLCAANIVGLYLG